MAEPRTILFICDHNTGKSVIAEAYCRRLIAQHGLDIAVASAGTTPGPKVAPPVIEGLRADGIDVANFQPCQLTTDELSAAWRVISLGCDLSSLAGPAVQVEHWDEVPRPTEDFPAARDRIRVRVEKLIEELGQPA